MDVLTNVCLGDGDGQAARRIDHLTAAAFSSDRKRAVLAFDNGVLSTLELESERELGALDDHLDRGWAETVSANGQWATSHPADCMLQVRDLKSMTPLATFSSDYPLESWDVAPDGRRAVAGDSRGRVHILRLEM